MARAAALSGKSRASPRQAKKRPAGTPAGTRARRRTRSAFLPPEMKDLLKRSWRRACGFALALIAGAFLLALLSYAPSDSSWNTESGAPVRNVLGIGGAWVADAVLQAIGLGGYVLALAVAAWSGRLASGVRLDAFGWRLLLLPVALLLLVAAFAGIPGAQGWPVHAGPGGAVGRALTLAAHDMFGAMAQGWPAVLAVLGLGIVVLLPVLGLTLREWRWVGATLSGPFAFCSGGAPAPNPGSCVLRGRSPISCRPTSGPTSRKSAPRPKSRRGRSRPRSSANRPGPATGNAANGAAASANRHRSPEKRMRPGPRAARNERVDARRRSSRKAPGSSRTRPSRPAPGDRAREAREPKLDLDPGRYKTPALSLLQEPPPGAGDHLDTTALEQNARYLETVLADFGIKGRIVKVRPGPVVTLYELEPAPGVKSSRVINLADDIARSMSALSVRVAVVPGRNVIGIELPNQNRETVYLREMMAARSFERSAHKLALALGKDDRRRAGSSRTWPGCPTC